MKTEMKMETTVTTFRLDEAGRLFVTHDDQVEQPATIRRAFPWSQPKEYFSVRSKEGVELLLIKSLDELPNDQRLTIEKYLRDSVFIPKITRIIKVIANHGFHLWTVETDRGPLELRLQEREDVRFLPGGRFAITDADGNVYEIEDSSKLDEQSQRELSKLV